MPRFRDKDGVTLEIGQPVQFVPTRPPELHGRTAKITNIGGGSWGGVCIAFRKQDDLPPCFQGDAVMCPGNMLRVMMTGRAVDA